MADYATRFLVGLGNPGRRYARTRHNVGFRIVERLWNVHADGEETARRFRVEYRVAREGLYRVFMARPLAFMNASGPPVRDLIGYYGGSSEDVLVIHDDLDLPLGTARMRRSGSSGGHKGIASLIAALGTRDFIRLKVGVGRPGADDADGVDFVLAPPSAPDAACLSAVECGAAETAWTWVFEGTEFCMSRVNRRSDTWSQEGES